MINYKYILTAVKVAELLGKVEALKYSLNRVRKPLRDYFKG